MPVLHTPKKHNHYKQVHKHGDGESLIEKGASNFRIQPDGFVSQLSAALGSGLNPL